MIKKFLFAFILSLFSIGFIKASAEQQIIKLRQNSNSTYNWFLNDEAFTNTTNFTYQGYTFCKPCIIRIQNSSNAHYYIIANTNGNRYNNTVNNYESWATYLAPYDMGNNNYTYELYSTPMFSDFQNASLYSRGLDFDVSSLLGGYDPPLEFDSSEKYSVNILNFDYAFKNIQNGNFRIPMSLYIKFEEVPTVPDEYKRMFVFDFDYLNSTKLDELYYSYGYDGVSWSALASILESVYNSGVNSTLDFPNNSLHNRLVMNLDDTLSNDNYTDWFSYSEEEGTQYNTYSFIWYEAKPDTNTTLTYNPNGLIEFLKNYYGDYKKALLGLCYVSFNYIDTYVMTYTSTSRKVFDYYNTYYCDLIKSNGTVYKHRSFKTQNTIDNSNIDNNNHPNIIGDNTLNQIPIVDITPEQRSSSYNTSIQDSYNNIVNNYYYNNNYNNSILDYYNSFSDGGSDEDINGAFGYVKSTLGSLTHVPILLGMCFTGFLPNEVILLFNALLIVFVVFLIVRIIKHLFTH